MKKVIVTVGLPASGKSTWAKEQVKNSQGKIKRVNKDDLRAMLDVGAYSKQREALVLSVRDAIIVESLKVGNSVIVDDTNLHPKHIASIEKLAHANDAVLEINDSFLAVPLRECLRRDALRSNPVGKNVINRMAREFRVGTPDPYHIPGLPMCIICDLDGTLAKIGSRNPYDASTCEQDQLNHAVAMTVAAFAERGVQVFFFTGREEKYREPTERWLAGNVLKFGPVIMRPTGNNEKDSIIKERMFTEYIRGKYNVAFVLDDRQQVVDMWRDIGVTCFQVAEGDF